jgi:hypothetical protein
MTTTHDIPNRRLRSSSSTAALALRLRGAAIA